MIWLQHLKKVALKMWTVMNTIFSWEECDKVPLFHEEHGSHKYDTISFQIVVDAVIVCYLVFEPDYEDVCVTVYSPKGNIIFETWF